MTDDKTDSSTASTGSGDAVKTTTKVTTTASPTKSSGSSSSSGSGSTSGSSGSSQKSGKNTDGKRAHPMQGKSLDYVSGPGTESYTPGHYKSDAVNDEEHLKVHFDR